MKTLLGSIAAWVLAIPFVALFLVFTAGPVLASLGMSFTDMRSTDTRTPFAVAFVGFFPRQIESALRHFRGAIVIRVFGLARGTSYSALLREHLPLSTRIKRGLYEEGVWTDSAFMRYADIGGLTWKGNDTLVIASRLKATARRLNVPGMHLGEVRQFLREKIGAHDIEMDAGPGIHLGTRDTRESV